MTQIAEHIREIRSTLKEGVQLVCVSKFHPVEALQEAYDAGERIFGESRVQELVVKQQQLPQDIQWHFIGHLQTNKVKQIAPFVSLLHSGDSLRLLQAVNQEAQRIGRRIPVLLEVHVAQEETKSGFSPEELRTALAQGDIQSLSNLQICGLMGMASNTEDETRIRQDFQQLHALYQEVKQQYYAQDDAFKELSMGMSGDYQMAQEEGSTMVRVGSSIFGMRY